MRLKSTSRRRLPTSARWSARLLRLIPMWDGRCSRLTSSLSRSVNSRICTHRSTCLTGLDMFCQLCQRHHCAQPRTAFTTRRESGQMSDRWPTQCPCRQKIAAWSLARLLVCSSSTGVYPAVSLWSPKYTLSPPHTPHLGAFPTTHPGIGCAIPAAGICG